MRPLVYALLLCGLCACAGKRTQVADDDTTVLTGLPDGTWYVKVYEGAVDGTSMSVDGAPAAEVDTVHGVADGSTVLIEHPADLGFTTPEPTPSLSYELENVIITSYSIS